jgi:hypothetical protein
MSDARSDLEKHAIEEVVLSRVMRLNATVHGLVFGFTFGLIIFIATIWLVIKGGAVVGPNLSLLGQFFIGYQVTFLGSIIGFFYGFITGFILGSFIAGVYNFIIDRKNARNRKK